MTTDEPRSIVAEETVSSSAGLHTLTAEGQDDVPFHNNSQENVRTKRHEGHDFSGSDDSNMSLGHGGIVRRSDERKIKHWKDSEFAVGCVNVNWKDDNPSWWFGSRRNGDDNYNDDHSPIVDPQFAISSMNMCPMLSWKKPPFWQEA